MIEFCARNGLSRPKYRIGRVENGTYTCSVRVGSNSSVFGDIEESFFTSEEAKNNAAKKAMNSLHREGLITTASTTAVEPSTAVVAGTEMGKNLRSQNGLSSIGENDQRVSAKLKDNRELPAQPRETASRKGTVICPSVAAKSEQLQQKFARCSRRQVLEQDEGLTLEEINRRVLEEDLPQSRDRAPLVGTSRPLFAGARSCNNNNNNNNGYVSEDKLLSSAMTPNANHQVRSRSELPALSRQHFSPEKVSAHSWDRDGLLDQTVPPQRQLNQSCSPRKVILSASFGPVTYQPPLLQYVPTIPTPQTHLLSTGELPTSPPPFLDTSPRPRTFRRGTGAETESGRIEDGAVVGGNERVEVAAVGECDEDDEVVYMGERTVESHPEHASSSSPGGEDLDGEMDEDGDADTNSDYRDEIYQQLLRSEAM